MFQRIEEMKANEPSRHFSVFVSFLQIYNEKVFDLLNAQSANSMTLNKLKAGDKVTLKDEFVGKMGGPLKTKADVGVVKSGAASADGGGTGAVGGPEESQRLLDVREAAALDVRSLQRRKDG